MPRIDEAEVAKRIKSFNGKAIAKELKKAREHAKLSREEVVSACGMAPAWLESFEADATLITMRDLNMLSTAYGYTIWGLIRKVTT